MLEIVDLHAEINGKEILRGINLSVKAGEVHAIMGPNGSGKSTLSSVLAGHPAYTVTKGSVTFNGKDLLAMPAEERRALYVARREKMLSEKIDYAKFLTWFIENYPQSQQQTRENQKNDAFWAQFKYYASTEKYNCSYI